MTKHLTILALSAVMAALALPAAASEDRSLGVDLLGAVSGELELTSKEEGAIVGTFERADSLVVFESVREAPERIAAVIEVHGARVEATYDLAAEVVRLDGGGAVVFPEDREALAALARRFENELPANAPGEFLYRLVNLLSEAPAGVVLGKRELRKPDFVGVERPLAAPRSPALEGEPLMTKEVVIDDPDAACQQDGGAGIVYLAGGCSWLYYNSFHDAVSHCYGNFPTDAGCHRGSGTYENCLGRCGAGCGSGGKGSYTTDCKDHDKCCRFHGGCTDSDADDCGDEYWEAADDYLWASTNCNGC